MKKNADIRPGYQLALLLAVPAGLLLGVRLLDDIGTTLAVAVGAAPAFVIGIIAWITARRDAADSDRS